MSGELTKLSETRWRYATARRVYYVRQMKAPNEDSQEPGRFRVDGGGDDVCIVAAHSVEQLVGDLRQNQSFPAPTDRAS